MKRFNEVYKIVEHHQGNVGLESILVKATEILDVLKDFYADINMPFDEVDKYFDNVSSGNTYNFSANITNHLNYEFFTTAHGDTLVALRVHLFGDVRGNYSETLYFMFDSIEAFWEALMMVSEERVLKCAFKDNIHEFRAIAHADSRFIDIRCDELELEEEEIEMDDMEDIADKCQEMLKEYYESQG